MFHLMLGHGNNYEELVSDVKIQTDHIYYLSGVINDDHLSLYVNGNLIGKKILSKNIDYGKISIPTLIGANPQFDGSKDVTHPSFCGTAYSVRIYDKALSDDEIMQNYRIDKALYNIEDLNE